MGWDYGYPPTPPAAGPGMVQGGLNLYAAIPMMGDDRLAPLMAAYDAEVKTHAIFRKVFGIV
jgi:hypothetical protein